MSYEFTAGNYLWKMKFRVKWFGWFARKFFALVFFLVGLRGFDIPESPRRPPLVRIGWGGRLRTVANPTAVRSGPSRPARNTDGAVRAGRPVSTSLLLAERPPLPVRRPRSSPVSARPPTAPYVRPLRTLERPTLHVVSTFHALVSRTQWVSYLDSDTNYFVYMFLYSYRS